MESIKIVGVGWHKTGTTTLRVCLEKLGYKHKSYDANLVASLDNGDIERIFEVANRYESFEDFPWPLIYKEMDKRYSNIRFILTTRKDKNVWYESLKKYVEREGVGKNHKIVYGYEYPHGHKKEIVNRYERHNKEVRKYFGSRDDFTELCWEEEDGWKELCRFLGRNIPEEPFPHANRSPDNVLEKAEVFAQEKLSGLINRYLKW